MKKKYILMLVLVLIVAGGTYAIREYTRGNTDLEGATPDASVTAAQLMNDYSNDEQAANGKYLNKVLRVSGTIKEIKQDSLGSYSIDLASESELAVVSCLLDERHNDDAAKLRSGMAVTITGLCTGVLMDVVLVRCAVE